MFLVQDAFGCTHRHHEITRVIATQLNKRGVQMNKITTLAAASLLLVSLTSIAYAQYLNGYTVESITEQGVTIKNAQGETIEVPDKSGDFEKKQKVMYDKRANKIKKDLEGC